MSKIGALRELLLGLLSEHERDGALKLSAMEKLNCGIFRSWVASASCRLCWCASRLLHLKQLPQLSQYVSNCDICCS